MDSHFNISRRAFLKKTLSGAAGVAAIQALPSPAFAENDTKPDQKYFTTGENNGDEEKYVGHIGNYTKGLPHDEKGCVTPLSYAVYLETLAAGPNANFERIPLGGRFRLANPQAAYAFALEGYNSQIFRCPAAPAFSSHEMGSEVAENYWHALLRDVPFAHWRDNPLAKDASVDLSRFTNFQGPRIGRLVNPDTLFRGPTSSDLNGPYLSQFLWMNVPYGATTITQRYKVPIAEDNHMTSYEEWLGCQRGYFSRSASPFDPTTRYLRNGRDLGEWVRRDFTFQAYLNAALILLGEPYPKKLFRAPFGSGHPYLESDTQTGFATFGMPFVLDLVTRASGLALKASWQQKWLVHRRVRPEEFGGHLHNHLTRKVAYPISAELLKSPVLERIHEKYGSYLLPMAYPDGCPLHPSYPAAHAVMAGAGVTVLKALFDESYIFPDPVESDPEGLRLQSYRGPKLTVGGELNKLASNISIARNYCGVHWRSDGIEGMKQGEAVALFFLQQQKAFQPEHTGGLKFTKFDGTSVTI